MAPHYNKFDGRDSPMSLLPMTLDVLEGRAKMCSPTDNPILSVLWRLSASRTFQIAARTQGGGLQLDGVWLHGSLMRLPASGGPGTGNDGKRVTYYDTLCGCWTGGYRDHRQRKVGMGAWERKMLKRARGRTRLGITRLSITFHTLSHIVTWINHSRKANAGFELKGWSELR